MTILNEEAIKAANMTSYGRPKGDLIEKEVGSLLYEIDAAELENADDLKADIIKTANAHLNAEGSYVSAAVAGGSKYKRNDRAITRATKTGNEYAQAVAKAKAAISEKSEWAEEVRKHGSIENAKRYHKAMELAREAVAFARMNKPLCYKALMKLYDVDPNKFIETYKAIDNTVGISNRSKPAKLYKEMV